MMTLRTRLGWLLALFLVQILYFPINRTMTGGVELFSTPLDSWIPLLPAWAIPYMLSLAWWAGCFIWAALKMEANLYRAFIASFLFTMLTSYVLYIVYPTYVTRPSVDGSGWQFDLLRYLYANDRLYNAFPSGHTYNSILILLYWWRWQPRLRWLWVIIAVIILLSTLFTSQHNTIDLLGGVLWAWMGYCFGLWFGRLVGK